MEDFLLLIHIKSLLNSINPPCDYKATTLQPMVPYIKVFLSRKLVLRFYSSWTSQIQNHKV